MAWASEGPGASKLTRFQINTKSVKANMMNISIESLSLIEDMVSEVFKELFLFPMAICKNKALLLIKDFSRNITIYVLSKYLQLLVNTRNCNWHSNQTKVSIYIKNTNFQSPSPRMLRMKFGLNLPCGVRGDVV